MATKWQDFPVLAEEPADTDTYLVRDISDTSADADGTVKQVSHANVQAGLALAVHTHTLAAITDAGTAAGENVGTAVGDVVQLVDVGAGVSGLPAVDGSQLLNLPGGGGGGGTVDTSGTPAATEYARFTDANTIEGRSTAEVKADLAIVLADISDAAALAALNQVDTAQIATTAFATQPEAESGTNNDAIMTPLRVTQLGALRFDPPLTATGVSVDHSVTPYPVTSGRHTLNFFTNATSPIWEFPAGLQVGDYGILRAPQTNQASYRRVAGSGISINGVANDAYQPLVVAGGFVTWYVIDTNTIVTIDDTAEDVELFGELTAHNNVLLEGGISGGGALTVSRGAGPGGQPTVADSGKWIETDGAITIPNTAIGSGWFQAVIKLTGDHDITYNGIRLDVSAVGITAPAILGFVAHAASEVDIFGAAGAWTEANMIP